MGGDMPDEVPKLNHRVDTQLHAAAELAATDGLESALTNSVFVACTKALCLAAAELREATLTASGLFSDGSEDDNSYGSEPC